MAALSRRCMITVMPPVRKPKRQRHKHFIKEWRRYRGLSQEQAAERLDISATTWGRTENGQIPYNQDFLEQAAYALQCEPWDLLNRNPEMDGDVFDIMRRLDEGARTEAADFIRFLSQKTAG